MKTQTRKKALLGLTMEEDTQSLKKKRPDLWAALKNPGPRLSLAWNVIKLRDKHQFTQVELAAKAGVSRRTIINIEDENGSYNATLDVIDGIGKAFGVSPSDLIKNVDLTKNF